MPSLPLLSRRTGAGPVPGEAGRMLTLIGVEEADISELTEHFDGDGSQV